MISLYILHRCKAHLAGKIAKIYIFCPNVVGLHIHKMSTIHNSDLFKEFRDGAKTQQLTDVIPTQLADKIVPVMEVNPKFFRRCNFFASGNRTTSGATTLATSATDKDTFITNIYLGWVFDVLTVITVNRVQCVVDGLTVTILLAPNSNAVAGTAGAISVPLCFPIKVDRGTAITLGVTSSAGTYSVSAGIIGYTVENIRA